MFSQLKAYLLIGAFIGTVSTIVIGYSQLRLKWVDSGRQEVQALWDADKYQQSQAQAQAMNDRLEQNRVLALSHAKELQQQRESLKNEITTLRTQSASVFRLRINQNICHGFASATQAQGTEGSDGAIAGTRLLPETTSKALVGLMLEADEHVARCRVLQNYVITHKLIDEAD